MPDTPQFENIAWYFSLFLNVSLVWRLASLRLIRRYPALASCMGIQLLRAIPLLTLDVNTDAYALTNAATIPVLMVSYIWVALEIYALAFEGYRGLFAVSRKVMLSVLAVSAIVAVLVHVGEMNASGEPFRLIRAVLLVESTVSLMLLFLLVAIAAFLLWYPAAVRKNLLLYSFSFSIYVASQCAIIFLRNSDPALTRDASLARFAVDDLCLLALVVFFRTAGEAESRSATTSMGSESRQRLLSQLGQLNSTLENKGRFTRSS